MEFIKTSVLPYAKKGQLFGVTNSAAQALSVGLTTTYTGLCIGNTIGNTKNLHIIGCGYALSVAPAAVSAMGLMTGFSATTDLTAGTAVSSIRNGIVGSATASVATAKSATTLSATPLYAQMFGSESPTTQLTSRAGWINLQGMIVVPPGGFVAWAANAVVTGFFSFVWAELDV